MRAAGVEQARYGALFVLADHRGHGGGEQALRSAHVLALLGRLVEAGAGSGIGQIAPEAEALEPVENLLGLRVGEQHRAVVAHMHEIVGTERIAGLGAALGGGALGAQAKDDARCDLRFSGGGDRAGAERQTLQHAGMRLEVLRQIDAEVGERQIGNGDTRGKVFQIDHCILELQQLLAAVLQIVHLVAGLLLDQVFLAGRGNVEQHHAAADPLFQVDVLLQLHVGPEIDELDALVGRADAINAAEALNDAHRVPVDVVVDQPVAVLKVLTLGDAVRGDEQVKLALAGKFLGPLFGARRECGEDGCQVFAQSGQRGLIAARAGDKRRVDAKGCLHPRGELVV